LTKISIGNNNFKFYKLLFDIYKLLSLEDPNRLNKKIRLDRVVENILGISNNCTELDIEQFTYIVEN